MAWSWSHTSEAYEHARKELGRLKKGALNAIWSEWQALERGDGEDPEHDDHEPARLNNEKYNDAMKRARKIPADVLADEIWDKMEAQSTCTNGGHEAWCCPFGCGCHMVSFGG